MYSQQKQIRRKAVKGGFLPMFAPMMGMMGNPMQMMGKLMGRGVVHPQNTYHGSGVVHPQNTYHGSGMTGGMDAATFFNPMTSPVSPISWLSKMFGGGQVGGKRKKRAPSARNQAISHLMKTKGMTLGGASRYIKENGY